MKIEIEQVIGCVNSLTLDAEGWALIPYSDSRHSGRDAIKGAANGKTEKPRPMIQRFDREAAIALVNEFKSAWGAFKRAVVGLPIFKGHPDAPRFKSIYPDKTPRGTIADMEVTDEGLRIRPVLTQQGADDVRGGCDEFSPFWLLKKVGEENGVTIARPFSLKSIGIVESGNIPGLSLVNALEDDPNFSEPMKNHIIKLLAAKGITLAADASDSDIAAAVDAACPTIAAANSAEAELPTVKAANADLTAKLAAAEASKTAAETEKIALVNAKTTAEDAFKAERKERATLLVNAAITDGRLPATEQAATVTALCNAADFPAEVAKLAARPKVLRTESRARDLGAARQADSSDVLALVNARMKDQGENYETAFAAIQSDPQHKALFARMKTPEIKIRGRR
jgi:hypothetical protein